MGCAGLLALDPGDRRAPVEPCGNGCTGHRDTTVIDTIFQIVDRVEQL